MTHPIDSIEFASLLCSRLCHDLLSPVGALNNGLELMADETDPDMRQRCLDLLADSARPPLMWNRAATCWQPYVQGFVPQTNSSYNGFRFEDVWIDRR